MERQKAYFVSDSRIVKFSPAAIQPRDLGQGRSGDAAEQPHIFAFHFHAVRRPHDYARGYFYNQFCG